MSILSTLFPKLAVARAFPQDISGYFLASMSGTPKNFSVGYNSIVNDDLINAITIFGNKKERPLIDEFSIAKSITISGTNYEHIGERTLTINSLDGPHSALMNRYAVTLMFDNKSQRVASDTYVFETPSRFVKIRSTFPLLRQDIAVPNSLKLISSLSFKF